MKPFRVIFLGTPDFAVGPLKELARNPQFEIVHVVSQPDKPKGRSMQLSPSPVKETALKLNLPVNATENVNTEDFLKFVRELKADIAVVIAFGQIVSQEFLDAFPFGCVNVHGSLLPKWRGAAPIQRSIQNGDTETGVALQIMVYALDAGPVLGVRKIPLTEMDTSSVVYEKLKKLSCELLNVELVEYLKGNLKAKPQDETQVTIAKKIKKEEGAVDWNKDASFIVNSIRAFDVWPGTWAKLSSGKTLKIIKATVDKTYQVEPGKIVKIDKDSITVACGQNSLKIYEVQLESKARQSVETFLRGYPLKEGEFLRNGQ